MADDAGPNAWLAADSDARSVWLSLQSVGVASSLRHLARIVDLSVGRTKRAVERLVAAELVGVDTVSRSMRIEVLGAAGSGPD